MYVVNTARASL